MTTLTSWISPSTMRALGWALVHFLWQGTALAALTAVAMSLVRRSSVRYVIGISALVLMLLAPIATFIAYSPTQAVFVEGAKTSPLVTASWPIARGSAATGTTEPARSFDALPWLVEIWLIGVALFSLRSAGGFVLLERERRRKSAVLEDRVLEICYT